MMEKMNALFIDQSKDNVVTATEDIKKGEQVSYIKDDHIIRIKATADIPIYHKISAARISKGENIIKYGEYMGVALEEINVGDYVHDHNVTSLLKTEN